MAKPKRYQDTKKLPISEVAKPTSHKRKKKRYLLERRMSAETQARDIKYHQEAIEKLQKNEWVEERKYSDLASAQKAKRQRINQQEGYHKYWRRSDMNEFRIREIEEEI